VRRMEAPPSPEKRAEFWSNVPTDLLLAELSRRDDARAQPECGSGERGSYDTAIHVFALFLILILSCLGV
jgi:zinc transporter 1/2/3